MANQYKAGANWSSKDGRRNIVIERELSPFLERQFSIRNLASGRQTHIGITGLSRKFRFNGFDPAYGGDDA